MSPTTSATIAQCHAPPGAPRYAQLKVEITPTPTTMNPRKIDGRLATLRASMLSRLPPTEQSFHPNRENIAARTRDAPPPGNGDRGNDVDRSREASSPRT